MKNHKTEEKFLTITYQKCKLWGPFGLIHGEVLKEWKIFKLSLLRDHHLWELFNICSWEFCQNLCFEASQAIFLVLSVYKELKQSRLQVIHFAAFRSKHKILPSEVWACEKSKILSDTAVLTFYFCSDCLLPSSPPLSFFSFFFHLLGW